MKVRSIFIALAAVLTASAAAWSQPYGMAPWVMGGYGPGYGMGPGMMMAPGMMTAPGMMWGYGGWGYGVELSPEQRTKIADIQQDVAHRRWELMEKLHAEAGPMYEASGFGAFDEQAARKAYDAMADAHKQMFESWLDARKRIEAVLTPEQREQLRRNFSGRWSKR